VHEREHPIVRTGSDDVLEQRPRKACGPGKQLIPVRVVLERERGLEELQRDAE
jgi:hypothetical protein